MHEYSLVRALADRVEQEARARSATSISRVAVRDPSFLNWTALGYAAVGNIVPDFPLINKSFNLSYCGHDL